MDSHDADAAARDEPDEDSTPSPLSGDDIEELRHRLSTGSQRSLGTG